MTLILPQPRRRLLLALPALGLAAGRGARAAEPSVRRVAPARALYELAYSPRRRALFVASAGGAGPDGPQSRLLRLDPETLAPQGEILLPRRGYGLVLDDAAGRAYVGHAADGAVSAVDVDAGQVLGTLQLTPMNTGENGRQSPAHGLRELRLTADGTRLFLPGMGVKESVLYAVRTDGLVLEKALGGIGPGATGLAFDAAGQRLFVSTILGRLFTIDPAVLAVRGEVACGGAEQPLNIVFDAASGHVLAVDQGSADIIRFLARNLPGYESRHPGNRVVAVEPETGEARWEVPTAAQPVSLLADARRGRLFVTQRAAGAVLVLDLARRAPVASIPLAPFPNSLALDDATGAVFVSVKNPREKAAEHEAVARIALG